MGSSNSSRSRYDSPVQESQSYQSSLSYTCDMINDHSINWVLRENSHHLTGEEKSMGREAQSLATQELNRTMKNCELVMNLDNTDITMRAGACDNRIIMLKRHNGDIEWKFTKRSFTQNVYSGVQWMGSQLRNFFLDVIPGIAGKVAKSIMWE